MFSDPDPNRARPTRARAAILGLVGILVLTGALGAVGHTRARAQDELPRIDGAHLVEDLSVLANDSMEGRRTGTPGSARARRFILDEIESLSLPAPAAGRTQEFDLRGVGGAPGAEGTNVMAVVPGSELPGRYIVVSAHYDHLGIRNGEIYNGADDNASGSAALLVLAEYFSEHRPHHSLLFTWFDAEEEGLLGSRAFLADPPVPLDSIVLDVNLDMVSRSASSQLYAAGPHHYPFLQPLVDEVAGRSHIELLTGHDSPGLPPGDDWTDASDHGPFHRAGIPFLYFGVEDHPGYHRPTDTFENVTLDFYVEAVRTIADFVRVADGAGGRLR